MAMQSSSFSSLVASRVAAQCIRLCIGVKPLEASFPPLWATAAASPSPLPCPCFLASALGIREPLQGGVAYSQFSVEHAVR